MITHLDQASVASSDPPEAPPIQTTRTVHTGQPGRPRIEIDEHLLATALEMRGPTHLAPVFNVSARTVRRRALECGLAEPGPPVYVEYEAEDGSISRYYTSSTAPMSDLTDNELDVITLQILNAFPNFGRRMITGHLRYLGHRIPRVRVQDAYLRVCGTSRNRFGDRRIERRVYSVPGPNSLWHHDGQHGVFNPIQSLKCYLSLLSLTGLIRWKIVIHAFIDGYSRLVTGIRASNNNRAETVLALFLEAVDIYQLPSRVRGDHGIENLQVAAFMEKERGISRGSYIWGRCVMFTF
jgi:hypothetical protein